MFFCFEEVFAWGVLFGLSGCGGDGEGAEAADEESGGGGRHRAVADGGE